MMRPEGENEFAGRPEKTLYENLRRRDEIRAPWATSIFGYDESGEPLIVGTTENPGIIHVRETGGVGVAKLHFNVLPPGNLYIFWDGQEITDNIGELDALGKTMSLAYFNVGPSSASRNRNDDKGMVRSHADAHNLVGAFLRIQTNAIAHTNNPTIHDRHNGKSKYPPQPSVW